MSGKNQGILRWMISGNPDITSKSRYKNKETVKKMLINFASWLEI